MEGLKAVLRGDVSSTFALIRPPGHHAREKKCAGFCFYNNAAICANVALTEFGLGKVCIFDWDVHHGDGT